MKGLKGLKRVNTWSHVNVYVLERMCRNIILVISHIYTHISLYKGILERPNIVNIKDINCFDTRIYGYIFPQINMIYNPDVQPYIMPTKT